MSSTHPHHAADVAVDGLDDEASAAVPDVALDHDAEVAAMRAAERIANDYRPDPSSG